MKFLIVTHTLHKKQDDDWFAYEPYIREMNLWLQHVDEVTIIAPKSSANLKSIEAKYLHRNINFKKIPAINLLSLKQVLLACYYFPLIFVTIWRQIKKADHVHLRCPGNIGLIGCIVQIFFPKKQKTVKYAGNWDPSSKQPKSYRLQKYILDHPKLTKNTKVLVYGDWENKSNNIKSFFTASYKNEDLKPVEERRLKGTINLIFVGGLTKGKRPLLSLKVLHQLKIDGIDARIDFYGDGIMRPKLERYIEEHNLDDSVTLHGNVNKEQVKEAFKKAHFLIFISKSEGWPKVVAEAMFWKCLPISSKVSCIPTMLDHGTRGSIIIPEVTAITSEIEMYISNEELYLKKVKAAANWSRQYTLDTFGEAIKKLLDER